MRPRLVRPERLVSIIIYPQLVVEQLPRQCVRLGRLRKVQPPAPSNAWSRDTMYASPGSPADRVVLPPLGPPLSSHEPHRHDLPTPHLVA